MLKGKNFKSKLLMDSVALFEWRCLAMANAGEGLYVQGIEKAC
jgi:hypothetical protein